MKKKVLIAFLATVSLSSAAFADSNAMPNLSCGAENENEFLGGVLVNNPVYGYIARLRDNYDSTQTLFPDPIRAFGLRCESLGENNVHCTGEWAASKEETVAIFNRDVAGNLSVTFIGNSLTRNSLITLKCVKKAYN